MIIQLLKHIFFLLQSLLNPTMNAQRIFVLRGIFRAEERVYVVGDVDNKAHFATRTLHSLPNLFRMRAIESWNFAPMNFNYAFALLKPLPSPFDIYSDNEKLDHTVIESKSLVINQSIIENTVCGLSGICEREKLLYRFPIMTAKDVRAFMNGRIKE